MVKNIKKNFCKRRRDKYIFVGLIAVFFGMVLVYISFFGINNMTGRVVLGDYTDEASCVIAGHTWENLINETCEEILDCVECSESCLTEGDICEPDCVIEYTEKLCAEGCQEICDENETECLVCEPDCVIEYTEKLCADNCILEKELCGNCKETCQNCSERIIGGQCVGNVCGSDHLDLCFEKEDCVSAGGYWYYNSCHLEEELLEEASSNETDEEILEEVTNESEDIEQDFINETEEIIEEIADVLTNKEREALTNKFGNESIKITKAVRVEEGIELTFELQDYSMVRFYDEGFSKEELNSQMEKDRINWLKDISNTLLQEDDSPEEIDDFIGEYPI
jgi:hypothetical protein